MCYSFLKTNLARDKQKYFTEVLMEHQNLHVCGEPCLPSVCFCLAPSSPDPTLRVRKQRTNTLHVLKSKCFGALWSKLDRKRNNSTKFQWTRNKRRNKRM